MSPHKENATLRSRENMANQQNKNGLDGNAINKEGGKVQLSHSGGGIFQIHVKGHLDNTWSEWLEGLEVELLDNGEMILSGTIADQAALMGILNKLNRLNLALLSVSEVSKRE